MNRKGFTLIELLAVIVMLGIILILVMPSILDSLSASKESSYKILINNIKTAAETYYQECEYGDLSDKTKYGDYACTINSNTITTSIGALANTGILKVPADDSGNLIVKDPRDTSKSLNECDIIIEKKVDSTSKATTYTVTVKEEQQDGCPSNDDFNSIQEVK